MRSLLRWAIPPPAISLSVCLLLATLTAATPTLHAQATPTATGPGGYITVGGGASYFQADYGKRDLGGYIVYADLNRTNRLGLEFEARLLHHHEEVGTNEETYLIGPRLALGRRWFNPYAKLLVGEGRFHFPYNYGEGTYLTLAPGAGLDVPVGKSRLTLRLIDFEYQSWPNFTYGGLNPYGVSAGLAIRIR